MVFDPFSIIGTVISTRLLTGLHKWTHYTFKNKMNGEHFDKVTVESLKLIGLAATASAFECFSESIRLQLKYCNFVFLILYYNLFM